MRTLRASFPIQSNPSNLMNINSIASNFILSQDAQEKANYLAIARLFFAKENLEGKSPAQILSYIGVSYMGAVNSSQKMEKGKKENYDSYVLYLSPAESSGVNVCRYASEGCIAACLNISGHALIAARAKGAANPIAISRLKKTWLAVFAREFAEMVIESEIEREAKKSKGKGHYFCARLNGTADIFWGKTIRKFPEIQFYDYTKNASFLKLSKAFPNWHLTFSFSGKNHESVTEALETGFNVAFPVVGKKDVQSLIDSRAGFSMDETDLRFLDASKGGFGLLTVKETPGTVAGIAAGFLLSKDAFLSFVAGFERKGEKAA
jgi:hypothetical protein